MCAVCFSILVDAWHPSTASCPDGPLTNFFFAMTARMARSVVSLCLALLLALPADAQDAAHAVRVRVLDAHDVTRVTLRAVDGTVRLATGEAASTLARLDPGETASIGTRSGEVYVRLGQGGFYAQSLRVLPTASRTRWSLSHDGNGTTTYAGSLAVEVDTDDSDGLQLVNMVPLETYVAGVVASEYTLDDTEGMKAMAVVARTYALQGATASNGAYDHVDHVRSQVYRGVGSITAEARSAAEATRGEVLTHDGRIIQAVYSSSSGGHTANNEDVWDADEELPYLRGKRDPYDTASPHGDWQASVSRPVLLRALSRHYGLDVNGFLLGDRSADGRVETVDLLGTNGSTRTVSSNDFRLAVNRSLSGVNLKSTLFDARRSGDRYVFEGQGFGHGVGLSQWGAHEMANRGFGYRDILAFYYTDIALTTLDDADATPLEPTTPIASNPAPEASETETTRRIGW
jgi:stage II sporulation protein D